MIIMECLGQYFGWMELIYSSSNNYVHFQIKFICKVFLYVKVLFRSYIIHKIKPISIIM